MPDTLTPEILVKDFKVYQPPLIMGKVDTPYNDLVKKLCQELKDSQERKDSRPQLAGNIGQENYLTEELNELVKPVIEAAFFDRFNANQEEFGFPPLTSVEWLSTWVNFQKKYEFNPIHTHNGKYSFVWWVQIPFDLEDELNLDWVKESNTPCASMFQWSYLALNSTKHLNNQIHLSKDRDEGTFFIFPANLPHQVYPFYTSDDYRISISGNVNFDFDYSGSQV